MLNKLAFSLVISLITASTFAAITDLPANTTSSAYAQDSRGVIVRNSYGLCWRAGYWTAGDAMTGCDGELIPPILKAIAPAIVATPEMVAPMPATSTTPVAAKRCDFTATLENNQTFAFNQATLTGAAKKRIDEEILSQLAACEKIDAIIVTGYTDHIGTTQYNQKLSGKRAGTVVAYLKDKGISAPIDSFAAGSSQLIEACDNKMNYQKLIKCLAPNRRVTIEVRGQAK